MSCDPGQLDDDFSSYVAARWTPLGITALGLCSNCGIRTEFARPTVEELVVRDVTRDAVHTRAPVHRAAVHN